MPIFYECDRCTACCRWPGQVKLSEAEISRIAEYKGVNEFEFIQEFTRLTVDRRGLAVADKPNGECIFLEGRNCSINSVKPEQCRHFPNLWNFPGFREICRAKERVVSEAEWERLIEQSTSN